MVGGQNAEDSKWPWMASIMTGTTKLEHICGGVLITNQHILTASHCINAIIQDSNTTITIRLGEYDFNSVSNSEKDFKVAAIYEPEPLEDRFRITLINDIAVVKLAEKVVFNDDIQPICLPPSNVVYNGQSAFLAGV